MQWFCITADNSKKRKSNKNILLIMAGYCFPKQCTGYFVKMSIKQFGIYKQAPEPTGLT